MVQPVWKTVWQIHIELRAKHNVSIQFRNHVLRYLFSLSACVYNSLIHNCQTLQTKISFKRSMNEQSVIHPGIGILLSTKEK